MTDSYSPWWCQPEKVCPGVVALPAHSDAVRTASSRVMPGVCVVSCLRSDARTKRVRSLAITLRLPAAMLLLELRTLARHPVLHEATELGVVRYRCRRPMSIRTLEGDSGIADRDREHGHAARLAVARAVRAQFHDGSFRSPERRPCPQAVADDQEMRSPPARSATIVV